VKHYGVGGIEPETGDPKTFTGRTILRRMFDVTEHPSANVYRVEFSPRARTDWHLHTGPQLLLVVEGVCRFQKWGEPRQEARAGDLISIGANEKHWHGATPDAPMVHYAFNLESTTEWLEKVTDAQYEP
jgi:quercetin dioxygenase-like cupin family protein